MASIYKRLSIDVAENNTFQSVIAKQFDSKSRFITAKLLNEGTELTVPSNCVVIINALRPDNDAKAFAGSVNEDGSVTVPITSWMLELDGTVNCDISIIDATTEEKLTTTSFTISVEAAAYSGSDITEDENYDILVSLIVDCQNAIVDATAAALNANTKASLADEKATLADQKATLAEQKATLAEQKATVANTAANGANTAASGANTAASAANTAAQTANTAADNADDAADRANAAAQLIEAGIDASNVTYDNTLSGLESTNVKNALDEIVTKFGSVVKVENWEDVQKVVRSGLASKVFKVGEQLECANKNGGKLVWDIIGFDHDVPVDSNYTHSMTIQLHDCYTSAVFDAREALFYAETELPAGTYNFKVITQPWYTADNGKTFQFTLTNALAAGSQIVLDMTYNQTLNGKSVKVYSGADSSTVIETATISEGNAGTALGNTDGTVENLNHIQKAIMGSNRWTHSGIRQWLNTDEESGWWTPKNVFDRPPSNSTSAGFLSVVDDELLAVIGSVIKRTALNTVTDGGTYEDSPELMFLLSRSELYGGLEHSINEGNPYPYYSDYSDLPSPGTGDDSNRIKYRNGSAQYWWQRSCYSGNAGGVRIVYPSGLISYDGASNSRGVAPACNII